MSFTEPGIAHLQIEGDLDEGLELVPRARKALAELQQRLRLGGIRSGGFSFRLGDDAYLNVRVAGNINVARIITSSISGREEPSTTVEGVPDFVSGIVTNSRIETKSDPATGEQTKFLKRFVPTQRTTITHPDLVPITEQGIERLAVSPYPPFGFKQFNDAGTIEFSQYTYIRPTMYSGAMKKVVQALLGFGKILPRQRPRGDQTELEDDGDTVNITKSESIYARAFLRVEREMQTKLRPTLYERSVQKDGFQVRFDYRFSRTHGICKGGDGTLYLVEISQQRGVIAMPLPMNPLTVPTKDADGNEKWPFRDELEQLKIGAGDDQKTVKDEDGLRFLEEFRGFPTGEAFPGLASVIESFIRGGEIIRLLDRDSLEPFYRHSFYSSAMGWAFNERGTEAHNTGWRFDDDEYQTGVHYQISINIGNPVEREPPDGAGAVAARARSAASLLENGNLLREMLVKKAYRLSTFDIESLSLARDDQEFIERLDQIEVEPQPGTASLRLIRAGRLYTGNKKNAQPQQIKFYEPLLGYLLSHDFRPSRLPKPRPPGGCDTTMHVFFDGDSFKWVRFFLAGRIKPAEEEVENNEDECAWIGTFTETRTSGPKEVTAGFYTSDYDDRQELSGSRQKTVWVRTYEGPTSIAVGDDPSDVRVNFAFRTHRFREDMTRETFNGENILIGVAVPKDIREAYYIGVMSYTEGYNKLMLSKYTSRVDPWAYEGWRCVVSTAGFAGWPPDMEECPPGCQTVRGVQIRPNEPRIVRYEGYNPYPCSEFIDTGPWAKKCDNADAMTYRIPPAPLPPPASENSPRKGYFEVRLVCAGGPRNKTTVRAQITDASWTLPKFNIPSPDEFGFTQNIVASANAFGDADSAVYMRSIDNQVYGDRPDELFEVYGPYQQTFMRPGVVYIGVV